MATLEQRQLMAAEAFSKALTATIVGVALILLGQRFGASDNGDWFGYGEIWDQNGAWLLRQGRDPLFLGLIEAARAVFGPNGYDDFRLALYAGFTSFAIWMAFKLPGAATPVIAAPAVLAAVMMKFVVQIREGVAFVFALLAVFVILKNFPCRWLLAGLLFLCAALCHGGEYIFLVAWGASLALYVASDRILSWRGMAPSLTALGVLLGVAAGAATYHWSRDLEWSLRDLGADTTIGATSTPFKLAYWGLIGLAVFTLRYQLLEARRGASKFGYAYATVVACTALPAVYLLCAILVFTQFPIVAATSAAARLMATCAGLALVTVVYRGKANLLTAAIALAMIVDGMRLLLRLGF
jgi:hypothetical protein